MGRFDSFYLFSDVDGTLMTSEYTIPQANIDALRRFTREGGHFALATGRGVSSSTFDLLESLPVNAPCVLLNGALLYDGEKRERLACFYLPPSARDMVERLLAEVPDCSVSIWRAEGKYEVGYEHPKMAGFPAFYTKCDVLPDPWCKLVIRTTPQEQAGLVRYLKGMRLEGLRVVTSCDSFVEVMPQNVSKATGIEILAEKLRIARNHILTMGDYYNDYEMLVLPGARCFCPENTPEDLKAVCERSFCRVERGAVAALIEMLERE